MACRNRVIGLLEIALVPEIAGDGITRYYPVSSGYSGFSEHLVTRCNVTSRYVLFLMIPVLCTHMPTSVRPRYNPNGLNLGLNHIMDYCPCTLYRCIDNRCILILSSLT
eukprot:1325976-Amorphochlora_amoeboformis.AAC.1